MDRQLASIKRITEVRPIEGADAIECAIVGGGWAVVVRKGEFQAGDLATYLEIDSWVPYALAPFLCRGKEPREYNGVKGERLRTIKLRGQISQGLLLPLSDTMAGIAEGTDLTEIFCIQKWEKPIPAQLAGQIKGNFPPWLRKTDQERVQNLAGKIDWDAEYEISTKLDGSSMTLWFKDGDWGVCSRNIDLKTDQKGNAFVDMARSLLPEFHTEDWQGLLANNFQPATGAPWEFVDGVAFQGELMGPGIQGNRENLTEHVFFVYDIWSIRSQCYFDPGAVRAFCDVYGLAHVPILHPRVRLSDVGVDSIEDALRFAEGLSINNKVREGVVFKRADGAFSFKAISNTFLLNEKEGD